MIRPALAKAIISLPFLLALFLVSCFLFPVQAADYQPCTVDTTCPIGEFLYDDEYTPIATASCALTTKDPAGADLLTDEPMTANSDGWYTYDFDATSQALGLYRSQMCCTFASDFLCLDKSFEVIPETFVAGDIATAVWGYSGRTLTGFGSLVADVWNYSSRSLTSFGTLVTSVWSNSERTLTSPNAADLAMKGDLTKQTESLRHEIRDELADLENINLDYTDPALLKQISRQVAENRDLLEVLVNEPIVKSFIEEGEIPDLSAKLNQTKTVVNALYAGVKQADSRAGLLALKLTKLPATEVSDELQSLENLLGGSAQTASPDTITSSLEWFSQAWGGDLVDNLLQTNQQVRSGLHAARLSVEAGQFEAAALELQLALDAFNDLSQGIGDVTNSAADRTLFGRLKEVQALSIALDQNEQALASLFSDWNTAPEPERHRQLSLVKKDVIKANRLPQAADIIEAATSKPENKDKNQALSLQAVTTLNRLLLAKMAGQPLKGLWLEEGSIVFKILITNPSDRISQTVPVNYLLPREVKPEAIMVTPPGITVEYNPDEDALYAKGEFDLLPGETKTFAIEVTDVWTIDPNEIASLRSQAEELMKPLVKTAFYGQGTTIKSDIDVTLNKLQAISNNGVTPEARIKNYREAQIELAGVRDKLDKLKDLVAQAGSSGTIFGFIGGVQAVAVWGIIIIFIAGFVFLTLYMRSLRIHDARPASTAAVSKLPHLSLPIFNPAKALKDTPRPRAPRKSVLGSGRLAISVSLTPENLKATRLFLLLVGVLSSTILIIIVLTSVIGRTRPNLLSPSNQLAAVAVLEASLTPTLAPPPPTLEAATSNSTLALLAPPDDDTPVNLRAEPDTAAPLIQKLSAPLSLTVLSLEEPWAEVEVIVDGQTLTGYLHTDYLEFVSP